MRNRLLVLLTLSFLSACGSSKTSVEDFHTRPVTLPDGTPIRAEVMRQQEDMMRGMMFRTELPEDRGMLFIHSQPGNYSYWMYQVNVPLDIIWMDSRRRVVEISENTPPCKTVASQCPRFGGTKEAQIVLELSAGSAKKHDIAVGSVLAF